MKLRNIISKASLRCGTVSEETTRNRHCCGFTLIELIVVISLIGLMLFFSLPRLQNNPFLDGSKKSARWLIGKVQALKESAIRDQKQYSLHFDLDSGRIWETNESMSQEDYDSAELNSYALPEDVRILDVEYPAKEKITSGRTEITLQSRLHGQSLHSYARR